MRLKSALWQVRATHIRLMFPVQRSVMTFLC